MNYKISIHGYPHYIYLLVVCLTDTIIFLRNSHASVKTESKVVFLYIFNKGCGGKFDTLFIPKMLYKVPLKTLTASAVVHVIDFFQPFLLCCRLLEHLITYRAN